MMRLLRRLSYVLHQRRRERELAEEMAFHRAMTEDAAAFGSTALAQNRSRDVWIPVWLQDAAQDLRFGVRMLGRDKRFTAAAVVALALGIAATNTIFVLINTALFKDLPFDHPRELVSISTADARGRAAGVSYADFVDWRRELHAFSSMGAHTQAATNVGDVDRAPERFRGAYVSADVFSMLRVQPMIGRVFRDDDDRAGATPVVVLGEYVWKNRYGSDPAVLGRVIRVNDLQSTVVGVMPANFAFPGTAEIWMPLSTMAGLQEAPRDARTLTAIGRLREGVTLAQARAELDGVARRLAEAYPATNRGVVARAAPPFADIRRSIIPSLMTVFVAVLFVLVIACANVATLLLARAARRGREIAIRASLGASRWRIIRQVLLESALLAAIAGAAALALSLYASHYFGTAFDAREIAAPERLGRPYWVDLSFDGRVFAFVAAMCLGSSILFGLAPALHLSRVETNDLLKDGAGGATGARAGRWTGPLMVVELALSLVLLSGAGLLARNYVTVYRTDLVVDVQHLTTARLAFPAKGYATAEARKRFLDKLELALVPPAGFGGTSLASDIPVATLGSSIRHVIVAGHTVADDALPRTNYVAVGRDYFQTVRLRLLEGRLFTPQDDRAQPSIVVNRAFADQIVGSATPIGHRVRLVPQSAPGGPAAAPGPWMTIVGVVPTVPPSGPPPVRVEPTVYASIATDPSPGRFVSIIVRSNDTHGAIEFMRARVRALDDSLTLYTIQTMTDALDQTRAGPRMILSLFAMIAGIAVAIALVGLFGLTAHGVEQRTREIGVRMALGARQRQVVWLFLKRTMRQLIIGITLGLAGTLAVGRVLQSLLDRTSPRDIATLAASVVFLVVVALCAAALPARRAARIDPAVALRTE